MFQPKNDTNLFKEDTNKILNEINQIINQRFQMTISAITVFGVFIAWIIPKDNSSPEQANQFLFAAPILLLIFLFLLFLYANSLNKMLNVLSTYLRVTKKSKWESDFIFFRGSKRVGYSFIEYIIFLILGVVTTLFPFLLCYLHQLSYPSSKRVIVILIVAGVFYTILVAVMAFSNRRNNYEKKVKQIWEKLLAEGKI